MYSSDYYTHNETLNPNLYPYFRVFIYENWKKELEIWQSFTEVADIKQGPAIR